MVYYLEKIAITTALVVLISEVAKRSSFMGALLASIPIVSVLGMTWLYIETKDIDKVSILATSVFWLVLPSLMLFIIFPILVKNGFNYYGAFSLSIGVTICCYLFLITALEHTGINL